MKTLSISIKMTNKILPICHLFFKVRKAIREQKSKIRMKINRMYNLISKI
jgi:hypothetical protein